MLACTVCNPILHCLAKPVCELTRFLEKDPSAQETMAESIQPRLDTHPDDNPEVQPGGPFMPCLHPAVQPMQRQQQSSSRSMHCTNVSTSSCLHVLVSSQCLGPTMIVTTESPAGVQRAECAGAVQISKKRRSLAAAKKPARAGMWPPQRSAARTPTTPTPQTCWRTSMTASPPLWPWTPRGPPGGACSRRLVCYGTGLVYDVKCSRS